MILLRHVESQVPVVGIKCTDRPAAIAQIFLAMGPPWCTISSAKSHRKKWPTHLLESGL